MAELGDVNGDVHKSLNGEIEEKCEEGLNVSDLQNGGCVDSHSSEDHAAKLNLLESDLNGDIEIPDAELKVEDDLGSHKEKMLNLIKPDLNGDIVIPDMELKVKDVLGSDEKENMPIVESNDIVVEEENQTVDNEEQANGSEVKEVQVDGPMVSEETEVESALVDDSQDPIQEQVEESEELQTTSESVESELNYEDQSDDKAKEFIPKSVEDTNDVRETEDSISENPQIDFDPVKELEEMDKEDLTEGSGSPQVLKIEPNEEVANTQLEAASTENGYSFHVEDNDVSEPQVCSTYNKEETSKLGDNLETETENLLTDTDVVDSIVPDVDTRSETEVEKGNLSFPVDDLKSVENGFHDDDQCLSDRTLKDEEDVSMVSIECACGQPTFPVEDGDHPEIYESISTTVPSDVSSDCACGQPTSIAHLNDSDEKETSFMGGSVISIGSTHIRVPYNDNLDVHNGDQSVATAADAIADDDQNHLMINENDEKAKISQEDSNATSVSESQIQSKPFYYLIRVPRYDDENLREQIKCAQQQVDEKTQIRLDVRSQIQTQRASCKEYKDIFEAAKSQERTARDTLKGKRQEIDAAQSVINIAKNANSIEDIDVKIRNMEHWMQHDTLSLKQEKESMREIKQLKQLREQYCSGMGKQDAVQQALDQKDQIEERLKGLKKEVEALRANVIKAENVTEVAKKKYYEETEKLNILQGKFNAADNTRQEAYAQLHILRKKMYEMNKYFRIYKDDEKAASEFATAGNKEELQRLCMNQVDRMMQVWNENEEYRKEYMRCNIRSTLWRLKTYDGRSLGPNEDPPVIPPSTFRKKIVTNNAPREEKKIEKIVEAADDKSSQKDALPIEEKKVSIKAVAPKDVKSKKPAKATPLVNKEKPTTTISSRSIDEIEEAAVKEEEVTVKDVKKEEAEKEEALRKKEEEEAKLKEQRRLEEKAKAKEALERKKRNLEKAQARAELKTKKEAEEKDKEREKRAAKKERKKTGKKEEGSCSSSETQERAVEVELLEKVPETTNNVVKKAASAAPTAHFSKHQLSKSKYTPPPPPLRNKASKKRLKFWMFVIVSSLVVLIALFFAFGFGELTIF